MKRTLAFSRQDVRLDGHFPGNPIVPAVAIMAELIDRVEAETGARVIGIKSARFRGALAPDVAWTVETQDQDDDRGMLAITCRHADRVTLNVTFRLARN